MKNKIKDNIYLFSFLAIISIPLIQTTTSIFPGTELGENRTKKPLPDFKNFETPKDYFGAFEDYFEDNFGFRSSYIELNSKVDLNLFNKSSNKDVILGKEDYLFYGEEMNDYNKINLLSDEQIDSIAIKLKNFQDSLAKIDREFLFFIGPNKSSIYPEYLTAAPINPHVEGNLDKLQKALDSYGVNYIDTKKLMLENKENFPLYHKRDTHWNETASILVANKILEHLNSIYNTNHKIEITNTYPAPYPGDLDKLLGLNSKILESTSDYNLVIDDKKIPKTLSYGDSFGNTVYPLINENFNQKLDMHVQSAPVASNYPIFADNSKLVLFEIVERNIPDLLNYNLDIFDSSNSELNSLYNPLKINFDRDNPNSPITIFNSAYDKLGENNYYFSSNNENGYILIDLKENLDLDYLYLNLNKVNEHNNIEFYWADHNGEFFKENSFPLQLIPDKNKYKIDVSHLNFSTNKIAIKLGNSNNKELHLNEFLLYSKDNKRP